MLTAVLILASAWWVKSLVFVGAALWFDLRRRQPPVTALTVAVAFGLSSLVSTALKILVDRHRPETGALIDLPESPSFPSGHATTAFAAAVALALLVPRAGWWAVPLAAVVAYSRVYLGVHYWSDVIAGAIIGAAVGWCVVSLTRRRSVREGRSRTRPPSRPRSSPRPPGAGSGDRPPSEP